MSAFAFEHHEALCVRSVKKTQLLEGLKRKIIFKNRKFYLKTTF